MNKYPLWFFTDIFLCIKFCLFPLSKVLHFYRKISLVLSLFQVWVDLVRINNEFSTNNLSTLVPAGPPKKQELWDTHQWIVDTGTKRRVPKCRMEQMSHSLQPPMNHHQTNGHDCQPSIATAYSKVPRHYILKLILVQCVHTHTHCTVRHYFLPTFWDLTLSYQLTHCRSGVENNSAFYRNLKPHLPRISETRGLEKSSSSQTNLGD